MSRRRERVFRLRSSTYVYIPPACVILFLLPSFLRSRFGSPVSLCPSVWIFYWIPGKPKTPSFEAAPTQHQSCLASIEKNPIAHTHSGFYGSRGGGWGELQQVCIGQYLCVYVRTVRIYAAAGRSFLFDISGQCIRFARIFLRNNVGRPHCIVELRNWPQKFI